MFGFAANARETCHLMTEHFKTSAIMMITAGEDLSSRNSKRETYE